MWWSFRAAEFLVVVLRDVEGGIDADVGCHDGPQSAGLSSVDVFVELWVDVDVLGVEVVDRW